MLDACLPGQIWPNLSAADCIFRTIDFLKLLSTFADNFRSVNLFGFLEFDKFFFPLHNIKTKKGTSNIHLTYSSVNLTRNVVSCFLAIFCVAPQWLLCERWCSWSDWWAAVLSWTAVELPQPWSQVKPGAVRTLTNPELSAVNCLTFLAWVP